MPETSAMYLNGSGIVTIFELEAFTSGSSTYIDSVFNSLVKSDSNGSHAGISFRLTSIASGGNTSASFLASSTTLVS